MTHPVRAILPTGMFEHYTEAARKSVFWSRYEASQFGSPEIEIEHLLLGILHMDTLLALRLLRSFEKTQSVTKQIEKHCQTGKSISSTSLDLPLTLSLKRVLAYAAEEAERLNQRHIGTEHLLIGISREETSFAAETLRENGLTSSALREALTRPAAASTASARPSEAVPSSEVVRNLSSAARDGMLSPLIGRTREMERLIHILSRRTRNNPVLVGEPGVGKTAIVEGLAQRIADGEVPFILAERPVFAIDASSLVAPSRRARSGERPETLLSQITTQPIGVLCVEGLLDLAASPGWGAVEATHVLEGLSRMGIQTIATGTPAGLRHAIERTGALVRHFEVVEVAPPTEEEAVAILSGLKEQYERFHGVVFGDGVIEAAVYASGRFLAHRYLPDRAIDLIDEAGARAKVRQQSETREETEVRNRIREIARKIENATAKRDVDKSREYQAQEREERENLHRLRVERERSARPASVITPSDIEEAVAERAGVPISAVQDVLQQKKGKELQVVTQELAAGISVDRCEWLPFLAAYLVGCSAEEAESLARAIKEARRKQTL
ncbi:MAG: hypothetical protein LAQ69_38635 [Acidobacteriia bacterium]|nr:hypothetical protein [Terriglobia bacterium]